MLVTSIFSFSHNVLKRLLSQTHQKVSLCWNGLRYVNKDDEKGAPVAILFVYISLAMVTSSKANIQLILLADLPRKPGQLCQKNMFNTIYAHTSAITYDTSILNQDSICKKLPPF